ncbi:hypothetical protein CANCADRAFT_133363 [Tortispora caseinolytica NRRL Y-17796]|uniref:Vacuolar transporter chaperone complex subunit 4 n=1 Tax=Tortispora caseinolytica NRRL Y-17796 TaxID=767744 RepID=A0A1E4TBC9_9ASCO|nr:hypothetical protein CANCADRAFT_133363 [Tortispora caseinolytica NRRL Y-17796]
MKFGRQLETSLIRDYSYYYIAYDDLKRLIKKTLAVRPWTEGDEEEFVQALEEELEKVYSFQRLKASEIQRRIKQIEKEVDETVKAIDSTNPPDEIKFDALEEGLSDIIASVHDLAKYTRLNYTGFQKIVKKHDKQTGWNLKPIFQTRLAAKPFYNNDYDKVVIELSRLYNLVRTRGNPVTGDSAAGGSQQNFVRQTTKYWVHPDNITEVKLIILKHLPVLVFNASKEFEREDSAISSIYFDNADLDLYKGRLEKTEGAEAIRLRWYGGMGSDQIFVERKTHREDWTGEKSVKARFALKEKNVNAFLKGEYTVQQAFEKMRNEGKKSLKEIEKLEQLAREVQYRVISKRLKPSVRSFYNRTAFQLPGDARVRISLDTELAMIREDSWDGHRRAGKNWRRMDIGVDYPFSQLRDSEITRFPYAILEVKLQTQMGQEPPEWVRDLVASHLVEAVPKFSKFIHGTATLMPDKVELIPYWLPQMDVDIRKPVISTNVLISRPGYDEEETAGDANNGAVAGNDNNNNADETSPLLGNGSRNSPPGFWGRITKVIVNHFVPSEEELDRLPLSKSTFTRRIVAPPGKLICVPVRIEPKVYFANERTFLSWLEISILLGSIAAGLIKVGSPAIIPIAFGFFITAVSSMLYSIGLYIWRVYMIRERRAVSYDDNIGPTAICCIFAVAIFANFIISAQ